MAITTYSELQSAIVDWMDRSGLSGKAAEFISLAEARLNRKLEPVATTANLTTTADSRLLSISALQMVDPVSLFLTVNNEEREVVPQALGTFYETSVSDIPSCYAIEGTNLRFDCPASGAYPARFTYQGRFALSDAAPTNEFLSKYPDLYLAACIVWGSVYVKNVPDLTVWKGILEEALPEVESEQAQRKRGALTVDAMLQRIGACRNDFELNS